MANYKSLTSNNYRKGIKWLQVPENKIDTVIFNPITNTHTENIPVAEETFTSVTAGGSQISLPCSIGTSLSDLRRVTTYAHNSYFNGEMCKGAVGIKTAIITHTFDLDDPVAGTPVVRVTLSGTTTALTRGANGYDSMPARDATSAIICNFINSNRSGDPIEWSENSDLANYSEQVIALSNFVRKADSGSHYGDADYYRCTWNVPSLESHLTWIEGCADIGDWRPADYSSTYYVRPLNEYNLGYSKSPEEYVWIDQHARLQNAYFSFVRNVTRVNGRRFTVQVEVPIMVYYFAAARTGWNGTGTHHRNIDSNGAFDLITSVKLELLATKLDDSSTTRSYSLDDNGELTMNAKNKNPFTFSANNFITLGTEYGIDNWMENMALYLLTEYKKGKYIVEFEVNAQWAISNNIQINTLIKVKNLFNEFISRDGRVCLFEIKTIEKQYKDSKFTYRIKALESATTDVSIGGIGIIYIFNAASGISPSSHDCVYPAKSNNQLALTSDEQTVQESNGFYLGNAITLTSVNTLPGNFIMLPGENIGKKILVTVKTDLSNYQYESYKPKMDAVLYSEHGDPTMIEQSRYYYVKNASKNSDYFVFLLNLTDRNYPYMAYIRINSPGTPGLVVNSMQIYNAGNANLTEQEAYDWLVSNNKLI